jgi:peroxiredoxin
MSRSGRAAVVLVLLAGCLPSYLTVPSGTQPGQLAPPIVGNDANGEALRLEDFKGKVVLLHFGYAGCMPCRAMLGRERTLVRRYQDRPFVVLGISADETPEELKAFEQKQGLTWRTCWDGVSGPIASVWQVERFPTLVLIDGNGMIRYRHEGLPREGELEARIEELLKNTKSS